jgi:ABC-type lipoprotein release transport system permease subunit
MQLALISALFGLVGGAVLGYWLATHIHSVAAQAASAITTAADKVAAPAPTPPAAS